VDLPQNSFRIQMTADYKKDWSTPSKPYAITGVKLLMNGDGIQLVSEESGDITNKY
jgi:hypothetical protein